MKLKLSMYYFTFFFAGGIYFPFLSVYLKNVGYSGSEIGFIFAAGSVGSIFIQPLVGMLTDVAKDYRSLIKLGVLLSSIFVFGFLFTDYFLFILITNVVMAIVSSPLYTVVDAIAVENASRFSYVYGQVRVWGAVGWSVMTFISGYILKAVGYDKMFLIYAILNIGLLVIVFLFPKLDKQPHERPKLTDGFKTLMRNPIFIYFTFIGLMYQVLVAINLTYLPMYYQKLGYPLELLGWNFAIAAVIEIPLFIIVTKIIKRIGLFPLMAIGVATFAVKYTLMGFAPSLPYMLGIQLLDGIGFALSISAAIEIVNLLAPERAKATAQTIFGAITGIGGLAGIIGNITGGFYYDHQGPEMMYWVMGGIAAVAALLLLAFPNHRKYHL